MEGLFTKALTPDLGILGTIIVLLFAMNFYLVKSLIAATDATGRFASTLDNIKDVLKNIYDEVRKNTSDVAALKDRRDR